MDKKRLALIGLVGGALISGLTVGSAYAQIATNTSPISSNNVQGSLSKYDKNFLASTANPKLNMQDVVNVAKNESSHHQQIYKSIVWICAFSDKGLPIGFGTGTFVKGTGKDGVLDVLTVRHIGDIKRMFPDVASHVAETAIFNAQGQMLGFVEPITSFKNDQDAAILMKVDLTKPHNMTLLQSVPGVPLYPVAPKGEQFVSTERAPTLLPGSSGSAVVLDNGVNKPWGIVGVIGTEVGGLNQNNIIDTRNISYSIRGKSMDDMILSWKSAVADNAKIAEPNIPAGEHFDVGYYGTANIAVDVKQTLFPVASIKSQFIDFNFGDNIQNFNVMKSTDAPYGVQLEKLCNMSGNHKTEAGIKSVLSNIEQIYESNKSEFNSNFEHVVERYNGLYSP